MHPQELIPLFESMPDPRAREGQFKLSEIMAMALVSTLAGCSDFVHMEIFCNARLAMLTKHFGILKIPSHDTFNRIFRMIDPASFESIFRMAAASKVDLEAFGGAHVAIDGKAHAHSGLHAVSAWSTTRGACLATEYTASGKGSELPAMVELVSGLNLKGCVATVDAMGCNDKMAAAILSSEGDYVMQLKENQPLTEAWAVEYFAKNQGEPDHAHPSSKERRGVVERECFVLANASKWAGQGVMNFQGAKSIALMRKTISKKGCADVVEMRYYASSLTDPALISQSIRSHWGVENGLHWTLDLRFGEDANLVRDKAAQKNLGLIRKLVLNAFKGRKMINYSKYMKKLQCSPEALEEELYMMRPSKAYPKI